MAMTADKVFFNTPDSTGAGTGDDVILSQGAMTQTGKKSDGDSGENTGNNPPGGPVDGFYDYAWYINKDSGDSSTPTKKWAEDDFKDNPDAKNPYLNQDYEAQEAALREAMQSTPQDLLAGTEGYVPTTEHTMGQADALLAGAGIGGKDYYEGAGITGDVNIDRIDHINYDPERALLQQLTDAQKQQAILQADRTVSQGISETQRNLQDAQSQFQTQKDQIAADEARAKDNQALYAEARGDRGGIGAAQYDAIMNNAAQLNYNVKQEQNKVAQEAQRYIATLRQNGEFEKANQLLQITQAHLAQLMDLYTRERETNLNVDEFNSQIAQWEENYKLNLLNAELDVSNMRLNTFNTLQNARLNQLNAQLGLAQAAQQAGLNNLNAQLNIAGVTGVLGGSPTWQADVAATQQLANSGQALLQAGIAPSQQQLEAMGLTQDQALSYLKKYFPNG